MSKKTDNDDVAARVARLERRLAGLMQEMTVPAPSAWLFRELAALRAEIAAREGRAAS